MKNVGFVGWRGMVGSVLIQRMIEENDFDTINPVFLCTSKHNHLSPEINKKRSNLYNARNLEFLKSLDIIVSCHGNDYTDDIYPKLRKIGWNGYWIDTSSSLRMKDDTIIVLDPINQSVIQKGLNNGIRTFVGGNCTVNLMLMSLGGLFVRDMIEWISVSTYQAASGGGSRYIYGLLQQIIKALNIVNESLQDSVSSILKIEERITKFLNDNVISTTNFHTAPLAFNLIPWIGEYSGNGQTKEEWKGQEEANKILNTRSVIPIGGICVRIGSLRCHGQSLILKLKEDISVKSIEYFLDSHNEWVTVVPNNRESSEVQLTPLAVSGTLKIPIGRLHKLSIGSRYLSAFTIGDQLLWGAAEPVRRILRQLSH